MPAKDRYHDAVVRALTRDDWMVASGQTIVVIGKRRLWVDTQASKASDQLSILVEVKGFQNTPSPVDYLIEAVGKYVVYRAALSYVKMAIPLYLAVPTAAYNGILSEEIGRMIVAQVGISLLLFAPVKEEIDQWIP